MEQLTVDLRSDTVTKPSPGMREAMVGAEVGDDVFGEDPTVNRLQERVAGLLGKEAHSIQPAKCSGRMASRSTILPPKSPYIAWRLRRHGPAMRDGAISRAAWSSAIVRARPGNPPVTARPPELADCV